MKSQPTVLPGSGGSGGPSIFTAAPPFDSGESLPPFVVLAFCLFSPHGHSVIRGLRRTCEQLPE